MIEGYVGKSADREVFLGFAESDVLYSLSFAEVLDEESGQGYQRRFAPPHSLDFRRYIQCPTSSTIPLTFNLRPVSDESWRLVRLKKGYARLEIRSDVPKVLSQVDCQHRLGHLGDLKISLPFMSFIGLTIKEEMEIFNVINGKAKGLSASLLDYHDAQLATDLATERPELFIALRLNDAPDSPWLKQLDLGGKKTSGMTRRASLRTMQKAAKRFLQQSNILEQLSVPETAKIVADFWRAVAVVLEDQWKEPRKNFITKGIGVYALMGIAADLVKDAERDERLCDETFFAGALNDFVHEIDWSKSGIFKGLGGEAGAQEALEILRSARRKDLFQMVQNG